MNFGNGIGWMALLLAAALTGCDRTVDGSNEDSARASVRTMAGKMADDEFMDFSTSLGVFVDQYGDGAWRKLDGLTAAEVTAEAKRLDPRAFDALADFNRLPADVRRRAVGKFRAAIREPSAKGEK